MTYRVFISHRITDTWVARQIAAHIHSLGAATFLDTHDIDDGDDAEERVLDAVGACDELLVLLTPWAIGHPWIMLETSCFMLLRRRIVMIRYGLTQHETEADERLFQTLRKQRIMELNEIDSYFGRLERRIAATVS